MISGKAARREVFRYRSASQILGSLFAIPTALFTYGAIEDLVTGTLLSTAGSLFVASVLLLGPALLLLISINLALQAFNESIELHDKGISWRTSIGRRVCADWPQVRSIAYSPRLPHGIYTLTTDVGAIHFTPWIQHRVELLAAIEGHLSADTTWLGLDAEGRGG